MSEIGSLYDNGPISPVVRIKENVALFTSAEWKPFSVEFIEPLPRSAAMVVDVVQVAGQTTIPAGGSIQKQVIPFLTLNDREFLHLRFEPLDDVEGVLWEQSSQGRFVTRSVQARSSKFTASRDPFLATTTFFVIGRDRDINLEVRNPNPVALPAARFAFWGYRYILSPLDKIPNACTYLPTEGKQA